MIKIGGSFLQKASKFYFLSFINVIIKHFGNFGNLKFPLKLLFKRLILTKIEFWHSIKVKKQDIGNFGKLKFTKFSLLSLKIVQKWIFHIFKPVYMWVTVVYNAVFAKSTHSDVFWYFEEDWWFVCDLHNLTVFHAYSCFVI